MTATQRSIVAAATLMTMTAALVDAFSMSHLSTTSISSTVRLSSQLHLMPEQGKQLEAAVNAAYARAGLVEEIKATTATATTATSKERHPLSQSARAFVSRVFALPSHIRHPRPEASKARSTTIDKPQQDEFIEWDNVKATDDVVLFPLVGFQCVQDGPNHYRAMPSKSTAACRLRNQPGSEEEVLVGWYSKACHLNMYVEDKNFCNEPVLTSAASMEGTPLN